MRFQAPSKPYSALYIVQVYMTLTLHLHIQIKFEIYPVIHLTSQDLQEPKMGLNDQTCSVNKAGKVTVLSQWSVSQ